MNKVGVVYSGQGSQYVGMGKELYENYKIAREVYEMANDILNFDLVKMCFEGKEEELNQTQNSQPAILTYSVALYEVFKKEFGIKPKVFAGHSLGEYSALACSGIIRFEDAIKLVRTRGLLMGESCDDGAMAAVVGINKDIIEEYCKENCNNRDVIAVSNYNTENQTIISGKTAVIEKSIEYFRKNKASAERLNVNGAFHCSLMSNAAEKFKSELDKYEFNMPKNKVISNVDALPYSDVSNIKSKLVKQLVSPVRWVDTMNYFYRDNINVVVEFGPKKTIRNFFKNTFSDIQAFSFGNKEDYNLVKNILLNNENEKENLKYFIDKCIAIVACTKNMNPSEREFTIRVIDSCRKIRNIQDNIIHSQDYDLNICNDVLELTKIALDTKQVEISEQIKRFNDLTNEVGTFKLQDSIESWIKKFQ
ncbi:ACP S-malonyltransferase [Clostridium beijerinckii]|uniref:ACP S-malonyltransferase n=1 Tax=Clostridium beijerinckii TaxID=1520 RepID=UPI00098C5B69|nr:ACP S-malonyltransferase [Clostridium beijerinckii]NRT80595.1 [acyl-carrier-protein] S-malonyltransferase [Clostridium beijerinckii]OOM47516.1 malonyl CoA-acyl carrier protein transacylase [Clostridium beijerinckii]